MDAKYVEEYTVDKAIRELEHIPMYLLSNDLSKALRFAIEFLKQHSDIPSLDDETYRIKYFRGYRDDWKWIYHIPTHTCLDSMRIGDLVDLVKTGKLETDRFSKNYDSKGRKLDDYYVETIKYMLFMNGYITEEERKRVWRK